MGTHQVVRFDASHTLDRSIGAEASKRIHGHSYRAEVTVRGEADAKTGMVVDFGLLEHTLADARDGLDHRLLDDVAAFSNEPALEI